MGLWEPRGGSGSAGAQAKKACPALIHTNSLFVGHLYFAKLML